MGPEDPKVRCPIPIPLSKASWVLKRMSLLRAFKEEALGHGQENISEGKRTIQQDRKN